MAGINLDCDWKAGFVMDPQKKQRVGYLCSFSGIGLGATLPQDISVYCPFNNGTPTYATDLKYTNAASPATVTCVGILTNWSWGGGVGDPIHITAYVSSENAEQIKAKCQTTLTTTSINHLSWWIPNYDEVEKKWFEEAFPLSNGYVSGMINAPGKSDVRLHIADEATKVAPNIDVNVYRLSFEIVPGANATYDMQFALSTGNKFTKAWGLVVGANPLSSLPA